MCAAQDQTQALVDPNETGWQEVKELGLEPEPAGLVADEDSSGTVQA